MNCQECQKNQNQFTVHSYEIDLYSAFPIRTWYEIEGWIRSSDPLQRRFDNPRLVQAGTRVDEMVISSVRQTHGRSSHGLVAFPSSTLISRPGITS